MKILTIGVAALLATAGAPVHAAKSSFSFSGLLSGDISRPGDHISGRITYDLGTIPDEVFNENNYDAGQYFSGIAFLEGMIGNVSFSDTPITIVLDSFDSALNDSVGFRFSYDGFSTTFIDLRAPSSMAFSGLSIPASLRGYSGSVHIENNRGQSADGLLAISAPIPEPATWLLMIAGFGAALWSAAKRRRIAATPPVPA